MNDFHYDSKFPDMQVLDAIKKYKENPLTGLEDILSLAYVKYAIPVKVENGSESYVYAQNKQTKRNYVVAFSTNEQLEKWREIAHIQFDHIVMDTLYMVYQTANERNDDISGIVIDPCTSSIMIEKDRLFNKKEESDKKIIFSDANEVPNSWLKKLVKFFKKTPYIECVYIKKLVEKPIKYVLIIDFDESKKDELISQIGKISSNYNHFAVAIVSVRKNSEILSIVKTEDTIYKK